MKKIKAVGLLIFILFIAILWNYNLISQANRKYNKSTNQINEQKTYTQEISKAIFYTKRYKREYPKSIDNNIFQLLGYIKNSNYKNSKIRQLSYEFFNLVTQFKYVYSGNVPYNILIIDQLIKDIYSKNMELMKLFSKEKKLIEKEHNSKIKRYHYISYFLLIILLPLVLYLFTQVEHIIEFVQKFTKTSSRFIENKTIKELKPITISAKNQEIHKATKNFNKLLAQIDNSIEYATDSATHTITALNVVESNIELVVSLIDEMQSSSQKDLYKKEDALIESLDVLMSLIKNLESLKKELQQLI